MDKLDKIFLKIQWPQKRKFQLVGMGLNAVDWICSLPHYPHHNSKVEIEGLHKVGGGQVATASALCARYGMKVRYIGRVGDDEIGEFSLNSLGQESMDISCVQVVPGATSQFAIILVDRPSGERTILWDRDSKLIYQEGELKREWIVEGQLLHLDGHDQKAAIQAAKWAKEAGMRVSLDIDKVQPGVEELLGLTDFLMPTESFVQSFSDEKDWKKGLKIVAKLGSLLVGVTRGKHGAAVLWEGEIFEIPGIQVTALDTTGAGDVFHGALLYGILQGQNLDYCLRLANVAAALSCTRIGARGGIPQLEKVLEIF